MEVEGREKSSPVPWLGQVAPHSSLRSGPGARSTVPAESKDRDDVGKERGRRVFTSFGPATWAAD